MRRSRTTLADVAAEAGVDPSVVSKVLSGDPRLKIRATTRERVRQAAAELDYRPNLYARALARSRAETIGLFVPAGNLLMLSVIAGAEQFAAERGLLLWTATHDGELPERHLRLLQGGAVDAALVSGLRSEVDVAPLLTDPRVPTLLLNRRTADVARWMLLDDEGAARMAVEYLVERGHRSIAFAGGPKGRDTAERRRIGFERAMAAVGSPVRPGWVASGAYTPDAGADTLARILEDDSRPTAVVAADATLGLGAWHEMLRRGLHVPRDISLIAINKLPTEPFRSPPMTCVEMPLEMLARRAAELVVDQPWDAEVAEVIEGQLSIFEGATVGPVSRHLGGRSG